MLDIKQIIENPNEIAAKLAKKGCIVDFAPLLKMSERRKELLVSVENSKSERNKLSDSVPQVKKAGGDVAPIFAKVKEISARMANEEKELAELEEQIKAAKKHRHDKLVQKKIKKKQEQKNEQYEIIKSAIKDSKHEL